MSSPIERGTRHSKIVGAFGEFVACNWLSRSKFEVSVIDHTGIDIIAYDPTTGRRLGITVKSRTRGSESENAAVHIFKNGKQDLEKLRDACNAFGCEPWIAIYVERRKSADLYLVSLEHYDNKYRSKGMRAIDNWSMGGKSRKQYDSDSEVSHIGWEIDAKRWPPLMKK